LGGPEGVRVPDLGDVEGGLVRGPIVIQVTSARGSDEFSYGTLRYRDFSPRAWRAYASDVFNAEY
jgi:hypothetical protein